MKITPNIIKEKACEVGGISMEEMDSKRRTGPVVLARQVAMYFVYRMGYNHKEVGSYFDRDHTYSVYVTDQIMSRKINDRQTMEFVEKMIEELPELDNCERLTHRKEKKEDMMKTIIDVALDVASVLRLTGRTKATDGKVEITDIPTFIRNRTTPEQQDDLLGLMNKKIQENPRHMRLDIEIQGDNLSPNELGSIVESCAVAIRDGKASGTLFRETVLKTETVSVPCGYYALVSERKEVEL
tara:strand:- start:20 stop:742 length:723 start_codon:yes stop_codon:yes gene_type:complete